jgi:2-polyprenyl-3-methyl-5-hydroxy-6-metoxy-1,4-benzoquinol methylase
MTIEAAPEPAGRTSDGLAARLSRSRLGMFDVMSVYVGDRLGLYRALHDGGPATPAELARRAGIDGRYAREWLEQQAASDLLEVDNVGAAPEDRRFRLPEAYVEPLLNAESPYAIAAAARGMVACAKVLPQLMEAYRSGGGVDWSAFGADMMEAQGDSNRPWLVNSLGAELLPAIPDVHARLMADPPARVADVACGVGWAAIAIARAYPMVRVDGFDLDDSSIELATQNASAAGVADRVTFAVRDAADSAAVGQYDLAVIIEAIHDMSRPVEALAAVHRMLRPNGIALVVDEKTGDAFSAPAGETERMHYGYSIFTCLPAAMTERPTAATGAVMRADTLRRYASEAGFTALEPLSEPSLETLRFYRLTP